MEISARALLEKILGESLIVIFKVDDIGSLYWLFLVYAKILCLYKHKRHKPQNTNHHAMLTVCVCEGGGQSLSSFGHRCVPGDSSVF